MLVAASALYAFGLWWMTLRPTPYDDGTAGVLRAFLGLLASSPVTAWVTFDVVEFAANVVMFVPFGVLAILWDGLWWVGILSGLATSAVIETSQALLLPTRVADARDLLANTLGTALGVVVGLLVVRTVRLHSERIADAIESS